MFFARGIKKSMQSQLGIIRKASFDATQTIINNPKYISTKSADGTMYNYNLEESEYILNLLFVLSLEVLIYLLNTFETLCGYPNIFGFSYLSL